MKNRQLVKNKHCSVAKRILEIDITLQPNFLGVSISNWSITMSELPTTKRYRVLVVASTDPN